MSDMQHKRMTRKHRQIIRRIIVRGLLVLQSPTCLGSGDAESTTDIALIKDSVSQCVLLTGASIAGALRSYLREYERGYDSVDEKGDLAALLFGAVRQDDDGEQSPLIVHDAISTKPPTIELRDGVKINSSTGTAEDQAKYDIALIAAGTQFPLQFELLVDNAVLETPERMEQLMQALAIALHGLESGDISLGMKKRRGFGRAQVSQWQVDDFDLTDAQRLRDWLEYDHQTRNVFPLASSQSKPSIIQDLKVEVADITDKRDRLIIKATFELASPILIRSGELEAKAAPDTVHLKSYRHGKPVPIISGSTLAGVLRHRAERIVNTLEKPLAIVEDMFGFVHEADDDRSGAWQEDATSSRLIVHESEIHIPSAQPDEPQRPNTKPLELVQTRIAIDRFTGGAYSGALFQEQPVFNTDKPQTTIELELRKPKPYEVGLLLLLIKDLWTEDLPIGGNSSIGRGRLTGKRAKIDWQGDEVKGWGLDRLTEGIRVSDSLAPDKAEKSVRTDLEMYVQALNSNI